MKPRKPIKRKRGARRGPWRSVKYRQWVAAQWCTIPPQGHETLWAPMHAAHTQNNGMSSKGPDSSCVPLCASHHAEFDAGRARFQGKYGVDMKAIAAHYFAQWLSEGNKP